MGFDIPKAKLYVLLVEPIPTLVPTVSTFSAAIVPAAFSTWNAVVLSVALDLTMTDPEEPLPFLVPPCRIRLPPLTLPLAWELPPAMVRLLPAPDVAVATLMVRLAPWAKVRSPEAVILPPSAMVKTAVPLSCTSKILPVLVALLTTRVFWLPPLSATTASFAPGADVPIPTRPALVTWRPT